MDIRQSSSTGSTKTERFHKRSQIITDHLANQPLCGVTCQSHTKTHIYADETSSFKTCFSSCLHSSLQFWLSPQKGLPPKIETCNSRVSVNNGACDLCFFSFQDPKFLSQKKIPRIVHPSASHPFGDHRVSSLWHHRPHQNESIPRSQTQQKIQEIQEEIQEKQTPVSETFETFETFAFLVRSGVSFCVCWAVVKLRRDTKISPRFSTLFTTDTGLQNGSLEQVVNPTNGTCLLDMSFCNFYKLQCKVVGRDLGEVSEVQPHETWWN